MAKKPKPPLKMPSGVLVQSIEDLRENYDGAAVLEFFNSGELLAWLLNRYYEEEAEKVEQLSAFEPELESKLAAIFGVASSAADDPERAERLEKLRQHTDDPAILGKVDQVAFDQSELGDLLDEGFNEIYLCEGGAFRIPLRVKGKTYIGVDAGGVVVTIPSSKPVDFDALGISFRNIKFDPKYAALSGTNAPSNASPSGSSAPASGGRSAIRNGRRPNLRSISTERPQSSANENDAEELLKLAREAEARKDFDASFKYFEQAAELGNTEAMNALGEMYANGEGVRSDPREAMRWYEQAADAGNVAAVRNLAYYYRFGEGVAQDQRKAMELYRQAAEAGDADAMNYLGVMYGKGEGVRPDPREAMRWYEQAADAGNVAAVRNMAYHYRVGLGVAQDQRKAMELYRQAAEAGDADAMNYLGVMYGKGEGVRPDPREAMRWYEQAADAGNVAALTNMAYLYRVGEGVAQDQRKAMELYRQAAEAGDADAMNYLGVMYDKGEGVRPDPREAMRWYEQAADAGNVNALTNMAYLYRVGLGVAQDQRKAMELYRQAAEAGDADAMLSIGAMYDKGEGVSSNPRTAMGWYKRAADLGNTLAMINLGYLYLEGRGVTKDLNKARELFERARELGDERADEALENLKKDGGCFITTAVCSSFGKPDDCHELSTFRAFRDNWLAAQPDGQSLIDQYYSLAPRIVEKIDALSNAPTIYRAIWTDWLEPCLSLIERKKYVECKEKYVELVQSLREKFLRD